MRAAVLGMVALLAVITMQSTGLAVEYGIFAWGSTIRSVGVENFVNDTISSGYTKVAVLIRGVSTPTRIDTLQQVYKLTKARNPNIKVYAWLVGFERKHGWDKPWDPATQAEIIRAVTEALPHCDGIILDDSFRYPARSRWERERAMVVITRLIARISKLAHAHGKEVYLCILPEDPARYSIDLDAVSRLVDRILVEAYTKEYHRPDEWVVQAYREFSARVGRRVGIILHDEPDRVKRQIKLLREAGCPEVWVFRYGEVRVRVSHEGREPGPPNAPVIPMVPARSRRRSPSRPDRFEPRNDWPGRERGGPTTEPA